MLSCPLTKMHAAVTPMGFIQPCCRFKIGEHEEIFANIKETSILEGRQSEGFKAVGKALSENIFPKGCSSCKLEEENGILSMRQKALQKYTQTDNLTYIEFFLGNTCNMKCRSCNPLYSSRWEAEAEAIGFSLKNQSSINSTQLLKAMDVQHLERLKLLGGEPFYTKSFYEILNVLTDTQKVQGLTLEFSSNASIFPDSSVIDQLCQFREVQLSLSIDDIGQRAEFLRSGTEWKKVSQVLYRWLQFKSTAPNFDIGVHITVSAYNVLHLDSILLYLSNMGWKDITLMSIKDPTELSPLRIPLKKRSEAWSSMQEQLRYKLTPVLLERIEKIVLFPEELPEALFLSYNQKMDVFRGESLAQYMAESHPVVHFWNDATCANP
ncbi:MAG: twitch domain-containing radical SAM protein [Bdellovibrionaceae bacterium]|nr:twitch domain-containing radical SAM protein [Pseudobdellovibrionaceae bacterium]